MMLFTLLTLLTSPAQAGRHRAPPDVVEDALVFAETDRHRAIEILEAALRDGPNKKDRRAITLYTAEQHRLDENNDKAMILFKEVVELKGNLDASALGQALINAKNGVDAPTHTLLKTIPEKSVLASQNADRFLLLTLLSTRENDARSVKLYSKKALQYAKSDPLQHARIATTLDALAKGGVDAAEEATSGKSYLERARKALKKGDLPRAAELAKKAEAEAEPDSFEALTAHYLSLRAQKNAVLDTNRIAVLLPMAGKYEAVGRQVKEAIEFGYRAGGGTRKLYFIDTGATPEGAIKALEKAVLEQGAVAVIGPLLSASTEPVVLAAAAMEVPLISLSQSNEISEYPWIFQGIPSIGDQAEALAKHVILKDGLKSFAIFAPDTPYGHHSAEQFRAAVGRHGGEIAVEEFYDPTSNSLMKYAAKLGKKNKGGRGGELARLREQAEQNGGNPDNVVLPPKINFQAIFIPDNVRKVPIACAALAYEEFAIGDFRPHPRDRLLPLLGLSGWNNKALVSAGNEYVRNSRFTDAFYSKSSPEFVKAYRGDTGRFPGSLEAVASDAARVLGAATRSQINSREDLRDALDKVSIDPTPMKATGFDEKRRRINSKIHILSIGFGGIRSLD